MSTGADPTSEDAAQEQLSTDFLLVRKGRCLFRPQAKAFFVSDEMVAAFRVGAGDQTRNQRAEIPLM